MARVKASTLVETLIAMSLAMIVISMTINFVFSLSERAFHESEEAIFIQCCLIFQEYQRGIQTCQTKTKTQLINNVEYISECREISPHVFSLHIKAKSSQQRFVEYSGVYEKW